MDTSVLVWAMFFAMVVWVGYLLQHYIRVKHQRKNH